MKFHSTVVFVKDIERSKAFYTQNLGFHIEHDFGKNIVFKNGLSILEIWRGHVICRELKTRNESNRFELYFEHDDIDAVSGKLENSGIVFLHGIQEESWGQRTVRFFDPDGHLIEVGEPLRVFVNNMMQKGMSEDQISEKSVIPLDEVRKLIRK